MNTTRTAGLTNAMPVWNTGTSDADASTAPMKRLPESPMKSRAGGRFQYRNPTSAPASAISSRTRPGPSDLPSSKARNSVAMSATPAASPSMLSSRFSAWQTPANQTVAISVELSGIEPSGSEPAIANTRNAPMASDATSLASGDSCSRSSITPTTNMASEASATGTQELATVRLSACSTVSPSAASVATAMATPPMVGVGELCQRSGRGGTTAPIAADTRRITAPSSTEAASATKNVIRSSAPRPSIAVSAWLMARRSPLAAEWPDRPARTASTTAPRRTACRGRATRRAAAAAAVRA